MDTITALLTRALTAPLCFLTLPLKATTVNATQVIIPSKGEGREGAVDSKLAASARNSV